MNILETIKNNLNKDSITIQNNMFSISSNCDIDSIETNKFKLKRNGYSNFPIEYFKNNKKYYSSDKITLEKCIELFINNIYSIEFNNTNTIIILKTLHSEQTLVFDENGNNVDDLLMVDIVWKLCNDETELSIKDIKQAKIFVGATILGILLGIIIICMTFYV